MIGNVNKSTKFTKKNPRDILSKIVNMVFWPVDFFINTFMTVAYTYKVSIKNILYNISPLNSFFCLIVTLLLFSYKNVISYYYIITTKICCSKKYWLTLSIVKYCAEFKCIFKIERFTENT